MWRRPCRSRSRCCTRCREAERGAQSAASSRSTCGPCAAGGTRATLWAGRRNPRPPFSRPCAGTKRWRRWRASMVAASCLCTCPTPRRICACVRVNVTSTPTQRGDYVCAVRRGCLLLQTTAVRGGTVAGVVVPQRAVVFALSSLEAYVQQPLRVCAMGRHVARLLAEGVARRSGRQPLWLHSRRVVQVALEEH
eukprot:2750714-Prymnesium_polylepis.1